MHKGTPIDKRILDYFARLGPTTEKTADDIAGELALNLGTTIDRLRNLSRSGEITLRRIKRAPYYRRKCGDVDTAWRRFCFTSPFNHTRSSQP